MAGVVKWSVVQVTTASLPLSPHAYSRFITVGGIGVGVMVLVGGARTHDPVAVVPTSLGSPLS